METETILDAMEAAREAYTYCPVEEFDRRLRQFQAFRARILRMDAAKEVALDAVTIHVGRLQKEILAKDARIAELEGWIKRNSSIVYTQEDIDALKEI